MYSSSTHGILRSHHSESPLPLSIFAYFQSPQIAILLQKTSFDDCNVFRFRNQTHGSLWFLEVPYHRRRRFGLRETTRRLLHRLSWPPLLARIQACWVWVRFFTFSCNLFITSVLRDKECLPMTTKMWFLFWHIWEFVHIFFRLSLPCKRVFELIFILWSIHWFG